MLPLRQLAVLALVLTAPADAQDRPRPTRMVGVTFDHWRGASGPALLRPTIRATTLPRGRPGIDLALVVFPDGISIKPPGVVVGLQAGLAQGLQLGPTIFLKGGVAGIAVVGALSDQRFVRILPGVHGGLGLLVPVDKSSSIRLDVTRHSYRVFGSSSGFWSFGVGFAAKRR